MGTAYAKLEKLFQSKISGRKEITKNGVEIIETENRRAIEKSQ